MTPARRVEAHLLGAPLCPEEAARLYGTARLPSIVSRLRTVFPERYGLRLVKVADRRKGDPCTLYQAEMG
jgi:hypothetical protein